MYLLTSRDYYKKTLVISTDLTNPESAPGFISIKVPHKGAVVEIRRYKTVKNNFQLFLAHVFLQSEYSV